MKSFARATRLPNVVGRGDYISNPDKQEQIMAKSAPVDWEPYQEYERSHQKTATKNNEGREIIVALPNEWATLPEKELWSRAHFLAVTAIGKSTDMQWAVHWNKARTDLHLHVVYSERQREENPGRWDRNIYHTAEGKVARTKADRAKDENGKELPPVHRKGELKDGFSSKDPKYTEKGWLKNTKERLQTQMSARWGVVFEKPAPLHEFHEGKGKEAPVIRKKNVVIRENNSRLAVLEKAGIHTEKGIQLLAQSLKEHKVPVLYATEGKWKVKAFHSPDQAVAFMEKTRGTIEAELARRTEAKSKAENTPVSRTPEQTQPTTPPAPPVQTAPEPPKAPFADLLEAQRELYRQTFALHDDRKPLDTAELQRAADIRSAAHDLMSALDRRDAAWERERSCGFFQGKAKKEAQSDRWAAYSQAEKALERLDRLGVYTRMGGIAANLGIHTREDFEGLSARAREKAVEVEDEAYRVARPKDALKGSPAAQRAAEERFKALCREIPLEQRRAARTALEAHENEYRTKGKCPLAEQLAHSAVFGVRHRLLADPEKERQREKVQERGQER